MPIRLNTAFQALYGSRALKLVQSFDRATALQDETWLFIYGGSTCVGLYAIQLAKLSGYKVVTVASPRNHELLKSYGADAVFDASVLALSPYYRNLMTRARTVQGSRHDPKGQGRNGR